VKQGAYIECASPAARGTKAEEPVKFHSFWHSLAQWDGTTRHTAFSGCFPSPPPLCPLACGEASRKLACLQTVQKAQIRPTAQGERAVAAGSLAAAAQQKSNDHRNTGADHGEFDYGRSRAAGYV
jgi:hypothetical protein